MEGKGINKSVLIYSPDWTHAVALKYLFCGKNIDESYCFQVTHSVSDVIMFSRLPPDFIILDVSPARYVALVLFLRKRFPDALMIFTQQRFLFSDRMTAEYFGGIRLKQYDAIMSGYPDTGIADHITSSLFTGAYPGGRVFSDSMTPEVVMGDLDIWIRRRLPGIVASPRVRSISLDWLVRGVEVREISRQLGRSEKVVHHYRWLMMRALGLRHGIRELIPSLTVAAGPVGWGGSVGGSTGRVD